MNHALAPLDDNRHSRRSFGGHTKDRVGNLLWSAHISPMISESYDRELNTTDLAVDGTSTEHLELGMLSAQQPIDPSQELASRY